MSSYPLKKCFQSILTRSQNPLIIKRECNDSSKKLATKNASLKTSTKNVLCEETKF